MNEEGVLDLFRKSGALLEGHFRLSSGLHSDRYLQSALVLQHPEFASALGAALAERVVHLQPTVVMSPALGGIVIGQEVGRALGVRAIFAERQDGQLALRRGFTMSSADRAIHRRRLSSPVAPTFASLPCQVTKTLPRPSAATEPSGRPHDEVDELFYGN